MINPKAIEALKQGDYVPEDLSKTGANLSTIREASLKSGIPVGELIKRLKRVKGIQ